MLGCYSVTDGGALFKTVSGCPDCCLYAEPRLCSRFCKGQIEEFAASKSKTLGSRVSLSSRLRSLPPPSNVPSIRVRAECAEPSSVCTPQPSALQLLPEELLIRILHNLPFGDKFRAQLVCKAIRQALLLSQVERCKACTACKAEQPTVVAALVPGLHDSWPSNVSKYAGFSSALTRTGQQWTPVRSPAFTATYCCICKG